jgi:HK97 family phage portal protein
MASLFELFRRSPRAEAAPPRTWEVALGAGSGAGSYRDYRALVSNYVLAAVLIRLRALSTIPVHVYRDTDGVKRIDDGQQAAALSKLISNRGRANPLMTAVGLRQWISVRRDVFGNAFVRVEYDRQGYPKALWPVSAPVDIRLENGSATYRIGAGDGLNPAKTYGSHEILHFPSPIVQDGGFYGRSLVEIAAAEVELSVDLPRFYSRLIKNGTHFGAVFQSDSGLDQDDYDAFYEDIGQRKGVWRAGKPILLPKGLTLTQGVKMTITEADLLKQQTFALQSVCRVFSVPPQMVADLSAATYSNVEQADIAWAKHGVAPDCVMLEAVWQDVLAYMGERNCYVKYELDGLMRGDYEARMKGHATGINAGVLTIDDARGLEDLPALGIDRPLVPLNMGFVGEDGEIRAVPSKSGATVESALAPVLAGARQRIAARYQRDGATERADEFARSALAEVAQAYAALGATLDIDQELSTAKEYACRT